jgi:hypothetical protein
MRLEAFVLSVAWRRRDLPGLQGRTRFCNVDHVCSGFKTLMLVNPNPQVAYTA